VAEPYDELSPLPSNLGDAVASRTMRPAILDRPLLAKDI
jgi:hypothetical protein